MKKLWRLKRLFYLGNVLCVATLLNACSTPKPKTAAKTLPQPISPEIKDGSVTFRYRAPKAKNVSVNIPMGGTVVMHRDAKGDWNGTITNLSPEIYIYNFTVDGVSTLDPGNPNVKPGLRTTHSLLEVPDNPPSFFAVRDVPHGSVTIETFKSRTLGTTRQLEIYVPPGYNEHPEHRYPILYLLHGSGDDERAWRVMGRAPAIADNLIADKKITPMIIVIPNVGYPDPEGVGMTNFETDMLQVIMPLAESRYRVQADAEHRAVAGLSMGAGQALEIGVKHPELFRWLGIFSNGIDVEHPYTNKTYLDAANGKLSLLWISIGEKDPLMKDYQRLEALLREEGVPHVSRITPGAHTWSNWRHYLNDFLPLLFTK